MEVAEFDEEDALKLLAGGLRVDRENDEGTDVGALMLGVKTLLDGLGKPAVLNANEDRGRFAAVFEGLISSFGVDISVGFKMDGLG